MPEELIHPEEPPKYAEHVNDPTHPAGNEQLAEDMANETELDRGNAAEKRETANQLTNSEDPQHPLRVKHLIENSKLFDELADIKEEKTRTEYLEAHPELTQNQEGQPTSGQESKDEASEVVRGEVIDPGDKENDGEREVEGRNRERAEEIRRELEELRSKGFALMKELESIDPDNPVFTPTTNKIGVEVAPGKTAYFES